MGAIAVLMIFAVFILVVIIIGSLLMIFHEEYIAKRAKTEVKKEGSGKK